MSINFASLDRYITGNWGEDQFKDEDDGFCDNCQNTGMVDASDSEPNQWLINCPVCNVETEGQKAHREKIQAAIARLDAKLKEAATK